MTNESGIILSIPQLRLCVDTLGGKRWDDLPLLDNGEPAEQRIMNAFIQLIQAGYFLPEADGFAPTERFADMILSISDADRVYQLWKGNRVVAFFYEKEDGFVTVCPDAGNPDHCRINRYTSMGAEEVKEQFPEAEKLLLKPVPVSGGKIGQSDIENLALFFGETNDTEEAQ